jgi:hypothetical protein
VKNDNDSPMSTAKSYQANNIKLEFGESWNVYCWCLL